MSAPMKPWETSTLRNVHYTSNLAGGGLPPVQMQRLLTRVNSANQAPPLPPRPCARNTHYGYNGGPSLYSGGYGMYGGGFGMPYSGGFGMRGDYDSRFLQVAEEATNGTFQSIESFVRAFSSITMMLESTYQALHMSFRSVLSVADNMSKLRAVAVNIFSSMSLLKLIYWMYRKVLYMLGLVNSAPLKESAWRAAESQVLGSPNSPSSVASTSSLPLFGLFGLMLGAPYLLYRLLASQINSKTPEGWDPSTGIKVKATCNFDNPTRGEIAFKKGDVLIVPADFRVHHGWSIAKLGNSVGYIPADRVTVYLDPENISATTLKEAPSTEVSEEPDTI